MTATPLTVLDLVPISSGSNAPQALRNSIDLAQQTATASPTGPGRRGMRLLTRTEPGNLQTGQTVPPAARQSE